MLNFIMGTLIILGIFGQILVTKNNRMGYLIWIITDIALAVFNFSQWKVAGAIGQGILWTIYLIVSLWGFIVYKKRG